MEATQSHAVEKNCLINMLKGLIFNMHNIKYFINVQYIVCYYHSSLLENLLISLKASMNLYILF